MDYKSFIKKYYSEANEYTLSYVDFFLSQVKKMVVEAKRTIGNTVSEKEIFTALFEDKNNIKILSYSAKYSSGKKADVGITKLYILKTFLINFADWLNTQNLIENYDELVKYITSLTPEKMLSEDSMAQIYFKSIDDVISFIDNIGQNCFNQIAATKKGFDSYDRNEDLLFIKTIAILSWRGYSYEEMLQIKKEDVCIRGNTNYCIIKPIRKNISILEYKILQNFASATEQRGLPSGRLTKYNNTNMLLRPQKSKQILVPNAIVCNLNRFNDYASSINSPFLLNTKALTKSGFYVMLHDTCKNNDDSITQNIMRLKNCDYTQAFRARQYYEIWRKMFYPDEK